MNRSHGNHGCYPDSGHGSLVQYPALFADHVSRFLDSEPAFS